MDFLHARNAVLDALAVERAQSLLADHSLVREAALDVDQHVVRASLVDVIAVYVPQPEVL